MMRHKHTGFYLNSMNIKKRANLNKSSRILPIAIALLIVSLFVGTLFTGPAYGQTQNLLLNGDFEEGYTQNEAFDDAWVAVGWSPFAITTDLDIPQNPNGSQPVYLASDSTAGTVNRSLTGSRSQMWRNSYSSAFAGVSQRVPVPADSTVRLSAWTYGWSSTGDDSDVSQNAAWMRQRIGIDPTGGTDPNSPDIIWSPAAQYIDTWGELAVEATSSSDHVTVYLSAYPNFILPNNEVYFDTAQLSLVAFDLPTPAPDYGIAGDGVPGAAPTADPLLIGLITGQGVSPGRQGIVLFDAETSASATGVAVENAMLIPWTAIYGTLMLIFLTALVLGYLIRLQFIKRQELAKQEAVAHRRPHNQEQV